MLRDFAYRLRTSRTRCTEKRQKSCGRTQMNKNRLASVIRTSWGKAYTKAKFL